MGEWSEKNRQCPLLSRCSSISTWLLDFWPGRHGERSSGVKSELGARGALCNDAAAHARRVRWELWYDGTEGWSSSVSGDRIRRVARASVRAVRLPASTGEIPMDLGEVWKVDAR